VCLKSYKALTEIIDALISSGYRYQVTKKDVEKTIMQLRGIDPRTVEKWLKALTVFEYLIPVSDKSFQLNPLKIPDLVSKLKEKSQTKMM
jgi:hypothetical protein